MNFSVSERNADDSVRERFVLTANLLDRFSLRPPYRPPRGLSASSAPTGPPAPPRTPPGKFRPVRLPGVARPVALLRGWDVGDLPEVAWWLCGEQPVTVSPRLLDQSRPASPREHTQQYKRADLTCSSWCLNSGENGGGSILTTRITSMSTWGVMRTSRNRASSSYRRAHFG